MTRKHSFWTFSKTFLCLCFCLVKKKKVAKEIVIEHHEKSFFASSAHQNNYENEVGFCLPAKATDFLNIGTIAWGNMNLTA